jgi:hypothetical protein
VAPLFKFLDLGLRRLQLGLEFGNASFIRGV